MRRSIQPKRATYGDLVPRTGPAAVREYPGLRRSARWVGDRNRSKKQRGITNISIVNRPGPCVKGHGGRNPRTSRGRAVSRRRAGR